MATANRFKPGDHLRIYAGAYSHHALYEGEGWVIHYTFGGQKRWARIRRDPLDAVIRGKRVEVVEYAVRLSAEETLRRARSRLGEIAYHVWGNNCEHVARWACTGQHRSEQVERFGAGGGGAVGATALVKAGSVIVATGGAVVGRSGPGLMSGLANVGSRAGVGLGVLGAVPAAASAFAVHRTLRDDPNLSAHERAARTAGRQAASVAVVAGPLVVRGAVHLFGTGAGAVRLASGLRLLGALVGGGMASGVAVAIALPALFTAGAGLFFYRARRRRRL